MYAIIKTGGKQYRVEKGDIISVERLKQEEGDKVVFDEVLVIGAGNDIKIGNPFVDGAKVFGELLENGKSKKVIVFKYKAKKQYRKKQGHRQLFSKVEITGIGEDTPKEKKAPAKADKDLAANEVTSDTVDKKDGEKKKTPSLKSMRKQELIDFAKANNIDIDEKATNAVLIETIEAALK